METYSFTKQKIADQRRAKVRRAAVVIVSTAACAALGSLYPDSSEAFGALRISLFAGIGAFISMVLTK